MSNEDDEIRAMADAAYYKHTPRPAGLNARDIPPVIHLSEKSMDIVAAQPSLPHDELEAAYGGCRLCYGKGYATTISYSTGSHYSKQDPVIRCCTCGRGEQLQALIQAQRQEAVRAPYHERNQLVAYLSKQFPAHLANDPDEPLWAVVCIHTTNGQMGWHIPLEEVGLFTHLEAGENDYDGHTTEDKYRRLAALQTYLEGEKQ